MHIAVAVSQVRDVHEEGCVGHRKVECSVKAKLAVDTRLIERLPSATLRIAQWLLHEAVVLCDVVDGILLRSLRLEVAEVCIEQIELRLFRIVRTCLYYVSTDIIADGVARILVHRHPVGIESVLAY